MVVDPVHNHGPEEGKGLACREYRTQDGQLRGLCMANEDKTVRMRYVCTANVLPEYVSAYLGEGWTIVDAGD